MSFRVKIRLNVQVAFHETKFQGSKCIRWRTPTDEIKTADSGRAGEKEREDGRGECFREHQLPDDPFLSCLKLSY